MLTEPDYNHGGIASVPTAPRKRRAPTKIKIGQEYRCRAEGFTSPFRGVVEKLYDNTAIVKIENTYECDGEIAKRKDGLAVVRYKDMEMVVNGN